MVEKQRCSWAESSDLMRAYHDDEWGVPSHDDTHLFEMLMLEGAQAGLSWSTILNKRENYRRAFDNFDVSRVARYSDKKLAELLDDPGIVRNRLKVASPVPKPHPASQIPLKLFGSLVPPGRRISPKLFGA